jgi:hypothetical protein
MPRSRPQQSLADYVAIAISPVLIMLLVGSLVFFLQQITYDGQYVDRVRWMLFWFVLATVLISRIGIEMGRSHAATYGAGMAIACGLFANRFLSDYFIGAVILLAIIWWCVDRLTWDCTFIDDREDQSGAGLLQQSGLEDKPEEESDDDDQAETPRERRRRLRREQLLADESPASSPHQDANPAEEEPAARSGRKQTPGVWVVYFSLAALPLFGVGQAFLPRDDAAARTLGFRYLWVYVASALGLLLTTSFLGLRRYLRQRKLTMPRAVTASWLTMGATLLVAILFLTLLIPRPDAETSVTALLDRFAEEQKASRYALAARDAGEGEGRRAGEHRIDEGEPGTEQQEGGRAVEADEDGNQSGEGERQGEGASEQDADGDRGKDSDQAESEPDGNAGEGADREGENDPNREGEAQTAQNERPQDGADDKTEDEADERSDSSSSSSSSPPPPPPSPMLASIAQWVKWLIYIVCGVLIVIGLYKNRTQLLESAREFFRSIANFWRNLFTRKEKRKKTAPETSSGETPQQQPIRPFADFPNPFLTGEAYRMRPDALVLYTEQAFRAFGHEQGIDPEEVLTAIEFGQRVEQKHPQMRAGIQFLTSIYSRILYSANPPRSFEIKPLEQLWADMSRS